MVDSPVTAVPGHVNQHVRRLVAQQPLGPRRRLGQPARQQPGKVLDRHLVAPVVDLDVVAVHVDVLHGVVVDGRGARVPRVARHVVGYHEDDAAVRDAQPLDAAVDAQHVGHVTVVEPEPGGVDQDGPVVAVCAVNGEQQRTT